MGKLLSGIVNSKVWNGFFSAFWLLNSILVLFAGYRPNYFMVAMLFLLTSLNSLEKYLELK